MDTKQQQASGAVLMVLPRAFGTNRETATSNVFQRVAQSEEVAELARRECEQAIEWLDRAGVEVIALEGNRQDPLPDEVFPNNWFSTHGDGTLVLYPMESATRRRERRKDLAEQLTGRGYRVERVIDFSHREDHREYLESTGSLVLDHDNRVAYACRSSRTHLGLLTVWSETLGYTPSVFDASYDGKAIYHTNVLMSVGTEFAIVALETVASGDRECLRRSLGESGREILDISPDQMCSFAANALEIRTAQGPVLALSTRALRSLKPSQRQQLERFVGIVDVPIPTIERVGGGSVRCMLAEIRLPRQAD